MTAVSVDERITAVRRFGYNAREAAFLVAAALHSGYFLQRQFLRFAGGTSRSLLTDFLEKVMALAHARITSLCNHTNVYHLTAKRLYAALGERDNRHRRRRNVWGIKSKVMALDYVLAHSDLQFLTTAHERVSFFGACGIEAARLPQRQWSHQSSPSTTRYFVDKFPIGLTKGAEAHGPEPVFAYIDGGAATVAGFKTYLAEYAPLLVVLPRWRLVFVSESSQACAAAEHAFRVWLGTQPPAHPRSTARPMPHARKGPGEPADEVLAYFRLRQAYESKQYAALTKEALDQLRGWRQIFESPLMHTLYERWHGEGDEGVIAALTAVPCARPPHASHFDTWVLPHSYAAFGLSRVAAGSSRGRAVRASGRAADRLSRVTNSAIVMQRSSMPLIPVQPPKERVSFAIRLDRALYDELMAYGIFLTSSKDHIIGHALKHVFHHDREFQTWLKTRTDLPIEQIARPSSNTNVPGAAADRGVGPADAAPLPADEPRTKGTL